jgi:hypothetical protein
MKQWEKDLDALASDGWSYGYTKIFDKDTNDLIWLVDISCNGVKYEVKAR